MQIKKINNNKLKVILNSNDLDEKNIDIDAFLSNSIESQDLFFEILDMAEEKYNFDIENNKAVVETISLDNNLFVLTITKLKNEYSNICNCPSKIYRFENIEDIFTTYSFLKNKKILSDQDNIFEFLEDYYLLLNNPTDKTESILTEYASPLSNSSNLEYILSEHGKKIY